MPVLTPSVPSTALGGMLLSSTERRLPVHMSPLLHIVSIRACLQSVLAMSHTLQLSLATQAWHSVVPGFGLLHNTLLEISTLGLQVMSAHPFLYPGARM